jgi:transcriptional regulator with XRE-family HTH domain
MAMEKPESPTGFAAKVGISVSYASEILTGTRQPSQRLAVRIFRTTGRKFGPILGLSDADIAAVDRIEQARAGARAA